MAQAAQQQCAEPGCSALVDSGRCDPHRKQHDTTRQLSTAKRGYDRQWQRLRLSKLAADPLCEIAYCKVGRPMPDVATEVNHIVPISERPDLRLVWENLESACEPCHRQKDNARRRAV